MPRLWVTTLFAMCLSTACGELTGRAPSTPARDAAAETSADAPTSPDANVDDANVDDANVYDARPCTALPRVDGTVDRYVPAQSGVSPFGASSPRALALDGRGNALLAGACGGCGGPTRAAVWRVRAESGQVDTTWGSGGAAFDGDDTDFDLEWWSVSVDPQGRALAGGYARVGDFSWPSVARFSLNGSPDTSFGMRGRVPIAPARFGPTLANGFVTRVYADDDGVVVVGTDEPPTDHAATRAVLARVRASDGVLDPTFAHDGTLLRGDLRGCFDLRRDGDGYVVACVSFEQRPALLRLDARGDARPWGDGTEIAEHTLAPRGFQVRTLTRDSSGAWLVVGAVLPSYADLQATPAIVRFTAEGVADARYGEGGVAMLYGVRQTVRYTFSGSAAITCEDRLLVGVNLGARPLVATLDRAGRRLEQVGERGYLTLGVPVDATAAALTGIAWAPERGRALVLTNFLPTAFSLQSVQQ